MKIGFIGLGKMGSRMVASLVRDGHDVVVWNRSEEAINELKSKIDNGKLTSAETIQSMVQSLPAPRVIWSMLPAGDTTEQMLQEIGKYVERNDIIIDGSNAHFSDTQRRYEEFQSKGIRFLGIGVSGGIIAEKNGYPLMVGGDESAYEDIKPILESLAKPHGGYDYFGQGGAGHYVKMVHNAIEYGMMQAFGEGFGLLEKSSYNFDLEKIGKLWQKGSIVSSFLLDRAVDALAKEPHLSDISGFIDASGEAEWSIAEAQKENVPANIISESLEFRKKSQIDPAVSQSFAAKMVAALRREFGGHAVKKSS